MSGGVVEMDPNLVDAATQFLATSGVHALAAELPEIRVGDLPDDAVDLVRLLREFDDARVAFDRRFAEGVDGAVHRLTTAVREVRASDARFLPEPAPTPGSGR